MSLRRIVLVLVAIVALLIAASVGAAPGKPFKVASTLDGKTVLPHRIHWLGIPKLPSSQVKEVAFLIDGKVRWIEHESPYVYGEDEHGAHRGYLVTSWLTPGRHRFSVRATTIDGRKATDTVVARVLPAPEPPAALAGKWQRTIADTSAAPIAGTNDNPTDTFIPTGTYTMVVDKRWIQVRFPGRFQRPASDNTGEGWILDSDYAASPTGLRALGPVIFEVFHEQAEGGWWCWQDGPPADYTWSVTGDTLTLTPKGGQDACGVRGFVWGGQWTRVG